MEPKAITVGATDCTDARAWFSCYGSCVDIYGPGVSLMSAKNTGDNDKHKQSGTSSEYWLNRVCDAFCKHSFRLTLEFRDANFLQCQLRSSLACWRLTSQMAGLKLICLLMQEKMSS